MRKIDKNVLSVFYIYYASFNYLIISRQKKKTILDMFLCIRRILFANPTNRLGITLSTGITRYRFQVLPVD